MLDATLASRHLLLLGPFILLLSLLALTSLIAQKVGLVQLGVFLQLIVQVRNELVWESQQSLSLDASYCVWVALTLFYFSYLFHVCCYHAVNSVPLLLRSI